MNNQLDNYPCICGHDRYSHFIAKSDGKTCCSPCIKIIKDRGRVPHPLAVRSSVHPLRMDNLKYLELKSKERE